MLLFNYQFQNLHASICMPQGMHLLSTKFRILSILRSHCQGYSVWKALNEHVNIIIDTQTFQNVALLTHSEQGRVTRSQMRSYLCNGYDKEDFRSIVYHRYKSYVTYIDTLIGNLRNRFQPWFIVNGPSISLTIWKSLTESYRLKRC